MGCERVLINVLNGPYFDGSPFNVQITRSSSSIRHDAKARLSDKCFIFLIYSLADRFPFLTYYNSIFRRMMCNLDYEANLFSRATHTALEEDNPTTWASTLSDKVALIQQRTFWSCCTQSRYFGFEILVGFLPSSRRNSHGQEVVPSTNPIRPFA